MPTRFQVLIPIGIAALIVGVAGVATLPAEIKLEQVEFPRGTIMVDDKILEVQIADTEPRRVSGLMFQETLPMDQGMLFVFDESGPKCKTTTEIMTCNSEGASTDNAKYALEVTAGFVNEFQINENSKLKLISI